MSSSASTVHLNLRLAAAVPPPADESTGATGDDVARGAGAASDDDADVCVICMDPLTDAASTRLECQHVFHVKCAMRWFRFEDPACPLCRSQKERRLVRRLTPRQRVRKMRRQFNALPADVQAAMKRFDKSRERLSTARATHREFMRSHGGILRQARALERAVSRAEEREQRLFFEVSTECCSRVPFLEDSLPSDAEDVSDDADDADDAIDVDSA